MLGYRIPCVRQYVRSSFFRTVQRSAVKQSVRIGKSQLIVDLAIEEQCASEVVDLRTTYQITTSYKLFLFQNLSKNNHKYLNISLIITY